MFPSLSYSGFGDTNGLDLALLDPLVKKFCEEGIAASTIKIPVSIEKIFHYRVGDDLQYRRYGSNESAVLAGELLTLFFCLECYPKPSK